MDGIDARSFARRAKRMVGGTRKEVKLSSAVRNCSGDQGDEAILATFKSKAPNSQFKLFTRHGQHFHILHDCLFSNGCCRCWKFSSTRRRTPKPLCREFEEEDWRLLFEYHIFGEREREVLYCKIGDTDFTNELSSRHEVVRSIEDRFSGGEPAGFVETCNTENQILWKFGKSKSQGDSSSSSDNEQVYEELIGGEKTKKRKSTGRSKQEEDQEKVYTQLIKICAAPITDGDRKPIWVHPESKLKFHGEYMFNVKLAKQAIQLHFCNLTLKEYEEFYEKRIQSPIWGALSLDKLYNHYFSREISLQKMMQLLIFQLGGVKKGFIVDNINYEIDTENLDWEVHLYSYMRNLIIFLDKRSGKYFLLFQ